jgi:endoglycosylceramidase
MHSLMMNYAPRPMRLCCLFAVLAVLAGCEASDPGWHVANEHLRAPDGRAVVLRGVNLSNAQKVAPYLDSSDNADEWVRLRRDFGFNSVRFVMTWSAIEPERGRYDDEYLDKVMERLSWAADAGIHVILDMHQDVYGEGFGFDGAPRWTCDAAHYEAFQRTEPWFINNFDPHVLACVDHFYQDADLRSRFVAAWAHVAEHLRSAPAVVGFDVLNEPVWGSYSLFDYERDLLMPLYRDVVGAVRRHAPGWVAFLEPGASRNLGFSTSLEKLGIRDVVYAPHSYDPAVESGNGFEPSNRTMVIENAARLREEARRLGAALWIGEYGGPAVAPGIVEYMDAEYDAFAAVAAGSMFWSYDRGDGYALLNADGSEKPVLADVLVRPYPERVAGDPISWSWDPDTRTFSFTYTPDHALALPTELSVPERCYPSGYTVDCGGCEVEPIPGGLRLSSPPPDSPATVTVRPR